MNIFYVILFIMIANTLTLGCSYPKKSDSQNHDSRIYFSPRTIAASITSDGFDIQKIRLSFRPENTKGVLANIIIKGHAYKFIVDTGASGHFLHEDIVNDLHIKQLGGSYGSTPYGDIQTTYLDKLEVLADKVPLQLDDSITVFNEPSNGLKEVGIFGLLSPPKLAVNTLVVLDTIEPALYLVKPVPENPLLWLNQTFPTLTIEEIPKKLDQNPYKELVVANSDIFGDLTMTIDSGATETNIYSDKGFEPKKSLSLKIKNFECRTNSARIRPTNSPGHGNHLLGMDCLEGKIIAFAPVGTNYFWLGWPK